jgi:hypothetical protein
MGKRKHVVEELEMKTSFNFKILGPTKQRLGSRCLPPTRIALRPSGLRFMATG